MKTVLMAGVAAVLAITGGALGQSCGQGAAKASEPAARVIPAAYVTEVGDTKDIVDTAMGAGDFKTLCAALKAAGLVDVLKGKGPFTVFAPTDAAFAKLPAGTVENLLKPENKETLTRVLTYHVVKASVMAEQAMKLKFADTVSGQRVDIKTSGGKVMIDNATVTKADIACSNGVIHVIDTVIMPSNQDVVETALAAGSFGTLAKLLTSAGLVETLKGKGPFTVFAPTDEAFAKLPKETLADLMKPENKEKLAGILTYHVASGRIFSDQAAAAGMAKTVQGQKLDITATGGTVRINNARVTTADVEASNGVIHVIDTVLMPK